LLPKITKQTRTLAAAYRSELTTPILECVSAINRSKFHESVQQVAPLTQPDSFLFRLDWTNQMTPQWQVHKADILKSLQAVMEHFNLNQLFT
jgi:hypothetical protein